MDSYMERELVTGTDMTGARSYQVSPSWDMEDHTSEIPPHWTGPYDGISPTTFEQNRCVSLLGKAMKSLNNFLEKAEWKAE